MKLRITPALVRFLAGLFTDLAAGWSGAVLIAPSFSIKFIDLPRFLLMGFIYSWFAVKMEEVTV